MFSHLDVTLITELKSFFRAKNFNVMKDILTLAFEPTQASFGNLTTLKMPISKRKTVTLVNE
jgi:hypothetical protein